MTSAVLDPDGFVAIDAEEAACISALIRPPRRPRTLMQFCRAVKLPDGPQKGDFLRIESEPAQRHLVRAIDSKKWRKFVFVAPSQRGKTLVSILIPWMHAIVEERLDVGYIMPNLDKLSQNWAGKIKPAIIGSGFGGWLPSKGPGSKDGRPAALTMTDAATGRSAITYFMAAGKGASETSLSSVSPARLAIDEVDDFEDAGQVELALKRLESWGRKGMAMLASTVNSRGERQTHPVLDFYGRSDATQCRLAHKCMDCGWFQVLKFDQFNLENGRVACAHCGVLWSEDHRHAALDASELAYGIEGVKDGLVLPPVGHTEYFSFLTTGFDYHMGDFASVGPMFTMAKDKEKLGDYSLMENFSHKWLCHPYAIPVDHESITDRLLTLRSAMSPWDRGVIPDDADRLVVAVDVQGDRCYWMAVASGTNNRHWIIDCDEWFWTPKDPVTGRPVEPSDADRHAVLDRIHQRARDGKPRKDGTVLKASLLGIDIGFNPGGSIGRWCMGKQGVVPVRGDHEDRVIAEKLDGHKQTIRYSRAGSSLESDFGFYEVRKQVVSKDQPIYWWFVKTQSLREHSAGRLRTTYDAAGSLMLPRGIAEKNDLVKHLSAWGIIRDPDTKLVRWVQIGKRDDYFDCLCYAVAMLTINQRSRGGNVGSIKPREANQCS